MGSSDSDQARIAGLETQMADLTSRLAALEQAASRSPLAMPGMVAIAGTGKVAAAPGGEPGAHGGEEDEPAVVYAGSGQFGARRMAIRQRKTLGEVLAVAPESVAPVFAGLANPARIALLYALVHGPRTSQQLREVLDAGSVGQLYHHLRELLAAGLIVQPARSVYQIPPGKIIAVCVAVSAAERLMSTTHQAPPPPELGEDELGEDELGEDGLPA